jgi:hypothetical protein
MAVLSEDRCWNAQITEEDRAILASMYMEETARVQDGANKSVEMQRIMNERKTNAVNNAIQLGAIAGLQYGAVTGSLAAALWLSRNNKMMLKVTQGSPFIGFCMRCALGWDVFTGLSPDE